MSARMEARKALSARMEQCIAPAPMTFLADPDVRLLTAELLLRDLQELGWTPPAEEAAQPSPTV